MRRYLPVPAARVGARRKAVWELYRAREAQRRGLLPSEPLDVRKRTGERVERTTSCGVFLRDPSTGEALLRVDDEDHELLALDGLSTDVGGRVEAVDLSAAVAPDQLDSAWRDRLAQGTLEVIEGEL